MAFLTLNGVTIPTAKGGQQEVMEIGDRQRAFDGTYIRDTRAYKRRWKFSTRPVSELRALMLRGLIQGRGTYFPFDGSLYGSNGLSYTGNATQFATAAADGFPSRDENSIAYSKFGSGSIAGEPVGTNMLTSAQSQASSTAGMTVHGGGSSIVVDATRYWQGAESIRFSGGAAPNPNFDLSSGVAGAFSTTYTFSCYIQAGTITQTTLIIEDTANATTVTSSAFTATSGSWRRAYVTLTTVGGGSTPNIKCYVQRANAADILYVDGLLLEATPMPLSWVVGGGTRATGSTLKYVVSPSEFTGGMTVNMWISKPLNNSAAPACLFSADPGVYEYLYVPTSTPTTLSWSDIVVASGLTYTGWHMVTLVGRSNPESGEYARTMYFDGAVVGTDNTAFDARATAYYLGSYGGTVPGFARMDEIQVLPFPVTAAWVSGTYSLGGTPGATPFITARGDLFAESDVQVMGQVDRVSYMGYSDAGTWRANGCVIDFTLEEV